MTQIALQQFGGMMPRYAEQKLPAINAELAVNCELTSGDLRPLRIPNFIESLDEAFSVQAAFRLQPDPEHEVQALAHEDIWFSSAVKFTHFVKGPLINDAHFRYYWTEEGSVPKYSTKGRIKDKLTPYPLGVPPPVNLVTVTPSGGSDDLTVTRVYLYTFFTEFGEESAPSEPTIAIGNDDGTWTLSTMDTAMPAAPAGTVRPDAVKRIYRTISGQTGTSYFFVAEIPLADAGYVDAITTDEVALNSPLVSIGWNEPPADMVGVISHPNGFLVGFSGRNIYFSIPYRPHAWPVEFTLSTESDISNLGAFGSSIGVPTTAFPYIASGSHPAAMSLIRQASSEPSANRYSVVGTPQGVLYASPNGLILLGPGGIQRISAGIVERDVWIKKYRPAEIQGAVYRAFYIGMYGDGDGFIFAFDNPPGAFSEVGTFLVDFQSMRTDLYSAQLNFLKGNEIFEWDNPFSNPLNYIWRSKEFVTAKPVNFGIMRGDGAGYTPEAVAGFNAQVDAYNLSRIDQPLDMLNFNVLGRVWQDPVVVPAGLPQIKQPLGGSPLLLQIGGQASVRVRLFGDRVLRWEALIDTVGRYRLPAGYKADIWQIEFAGDAIIHHVKLAETGKDLARI